MKKATSIVIALFVCVMLVCTTNDQPIDPGISAATGSLEVTFNINRVGALHKTRVIEMMNLYVAISAENQDTIFDTIPLGGGSHQRTVQQTYDRLASLTGEHAIEWTLSAEALDRNGRIIHSGDTVFVIPPGDTVEIPLSLGARYSMMVANYFPIRDSVSRCNLQIDGYTEIDSSFPEQSLVGDTVTLSFDYLTASSSGISHQITLNVFGDAGGNDALLYTGDTSIVVRSGEDADYTVILAYVGPNTGSGASAMAVTLGDVGKTTVNGELQGNDVHMLTLTSAGNGTVSGPGPVIHGIPHVISAAPDAGYRFVVWRVTEGEATIADSNATSTTATLENGDATIMGIFSANTFQGMVLIPASGHTFLMGDEDFATPVHRVSFTHDFWMDTTEVTQKSYAGLMAATYDNFVAPPWDTIYGKGDDYPANYLNWFDAVLYCNARTKAAGSGDTVYRYTSIQGNPGDSCILNGLVVDMNKNGFHLPTEAQWEYAYRAGTTTNYYWGNDSVTIDGYAWCQGNSGVRGHPVAQKSPNVFNLYDMSGNIFEWCNDWWWQYESGDQVDPTGPDSTPAGIRVLRGGSWGSPPAVSNSSYRVSMPPSLVIPPNGFRTCFTVR
jgi:formylglycine-generating enzyme